MKRLLVLLTLLTMAGISSATLHTVILSGISFTPANLTIQQGDTVRWMNQGGFHNVAEVSTPPVFRSGDPTSSNFTYDFVFAAPLSGTYSYICEIHAPSMAGTITVEAGGSPPTVPSNPTPQNGATDFPLLGFLIWESDGADHFVVQFGTQDPPPVVDDNFANMMYAYSELNPGTEYFWKITAVNDFGQAESPVWHFTTADVPGMATNPDPADNATDVAVTTSLGWDAADRATSYEVYMGTAEPLGLLGTTTETMLTPSADLLNSTTYMWRVDAINDIGTTSSNTWSFTTEAVNAVGDVELPASFDVGEAYPNPFNSNVRINLAIASENLVTVRVFDVLGRQVTTLVNSRLSAGQHILEWNATGHSAGLYFMRAESAGLVQTQKLIYLP
ncbi:MAG: T9SS type A sorting domain-containing protein [Calditrichaeota bacterium]|nr:T9SS type A sorting domain-containing protein [Calditrichota bacterium]MCB9369958.1 T9SS type A sorting domain-containing protein [Calditrichota bacterium]